MPMSFGERRLSRCSARSVGQGRAVDDVTIVRAVHVLSVVLWIGGVGFVTKVGDQVYSVGYYPSKGG